MLVYIFIEENKYLEIQISHQRKVVEKCNLQTAMTLFQLGKTYVFLEELN